MKDKKEVYEQIEEIKELLDQELLEENPNKEKILLISEKIDLMINEYMKK